MQEADPFNWPSDFGALEADPPQGWVILNTVLDPVLLVQREGENIRVVLSARLHRRSGLVTLVAPTLTSSWAFGGGLICPLPKDVGLYVKDRLTGLDPMRLTFAQALALHRSTRQELDVELDPSVLTSANEAAVAVGPIEVAGLNATPFPYQAQGIAWMRETISHTGGVVLADEMGLGKTLQIIALLLLERPTRESPALIVCPTTLIANWVRELARFAPDLELVVHRGSERARLHSHLQRSNVLITTYDTLVNDQVIFEAVRWSWLICDEAQALKNPDSQRRSVVAALHRRRAVPVTGTPVENHLLDLWSLVDIAIPGLLGDRATFERLYPDTQDSARALALVTNPVVLKRRVRDVAQDLPTRTDIPVPLELGAGLADGYEQVRLDALEKYPRAGAMVATGQLQLFCAHPSLTTTDTSVEGWEDAVLLQQGAVRLSTPKLERTIELIGEAFSNSRKVLLFANFNACGSIIQGATSWPPSSYWGAINGGTPSALRQQIVDEFSAHDGPAILVLNPRAAGAGLNITAATVVIHYTQVWNPALELQASARAHRRGQTLPVTIYHMYYIDTVEEVMMERAQRRRELGEEAVPTSAQEQAELSRALTLTPVGGR